jgi:hypothetical protein
MNPPRATRNRRAEVFPIVARLYRSGALPIELPERAGVPASRVAHYTQTMLIPALDWWEGYLLWQGHSGSKVKRGDKLLNNARRLLMTARWAPEDAEERRRFDAALAELRRIQSETGADVWNEAEQRWEFDEDRQQQLKAARASHPCLTKVLEKARRMADADCKQLRRRGHRLRQERQERAADGRLAEHDRLRRNISTWKKRGRLREPRPVPSYPPDLGGVSWAEFRGAGQDHAPMQ